MAMNGHLSMSGANAERASITRLQHDFLHNILAMHVHHSDLPDYYGDGNHQAESLVVIMEHSFELWGKYLTITRLQQPMDFDTFEQKVRGNYLLYRQTDEDNFKASWCAAHAHDSPISAFEARRLGLPPYEGTDLKAAPGAVNKWGETFPEKFDFPEGVIEGYYAASMRLREHMLDTLVDAGYTHVSQGAFYEFLRTLHQRDLFAIVSGENPDATLRFDARRVTAANDPGAPGPVLEDNVATCE